MGNVRKLTPAAVGFRAHSGWTAAVAVAGPRRSPTVIDRRRIELITPGIPKQPYHAAEGLPLKQAEQIIRRSEATAGRLAREGLREVRDALEEKGFQLVTCGVLLGSGRPLPSLAAILASHPLIHTAEGELFRNVLVRASQRCKLSVNGVKEREVLARAGAALRVPAGQLQQRLTEMGRTIGPPWRQDEKLAALAAWLALAAPRAAKAESPPRRSRRGR